MARLHAPGKEAGGVSPTGPGSGWKVLDLLSGPLPPSPQASVNRGLARALGRRFWNNKKSRVRLWVCMDSAARGLRRHPERGLGPEQCEDVDPGAREPKRIPDILGAGVPPAQGATQRMWAHQRPRHGVTADPQARGYGGRFAKALFPEKRLSCDLLLGRAVEGAPRDPPGRDSQTRPARRPHVRRSSVPRVSCAVHAVALVARCLRVEHHDARVGS